MANINILIRPLINKDYVEFLKTLDEVTMRCYTISRQREPSGCWEQLLIELTNQSTKESRVATKFDRTHEVLAGVYLITTPICKFGYSMEMS